MKRYEDLDARGAARPAKARRGHTTIRAPVSHAGSLGRGGGDPQWLYRMLETRRQEMKTIDAKAKGLKAVNSTLKKLLNGQPVAVKNASHLHGLGAGLKHGEVVINGS